MGQLLTMENLVALVSLVALEITLGIDNIVFIAILSGKLPPEQQGRAQKVGLLMAMFTRVILLLSIAWVMRLVTPLFGFFGRDVSGRDLILIVGGLFLLAKATFEIHDKLEAPRHARQVKRTAHGFKSVVFQIMLLDIIFSLDSVITAVGMARSVVVMILAIMAAVAVMMFFAGAVSRFIDKHPTVKMLALSFLLLIGVVLVAEGLGKHIDRAYIYFAMAFSLLVEMLNLRMRRVAAAATDDE